MDTREVVEHAAELGFLSGVDLAKARRLAEAHQQVRSLMHTRIDAMVGAFDNHDPGILRAKDVDAVEDMYRCPRDCGFVGTEAEWKRHLADKLADALAGA
ncbi:hypothetical protein [Mycobacterium sp. 48b]|uniref:hypothetical protein n=1 Tax=Mycobacterium sp. 48b TaxID=3400426 RepID=UPI003AADD2EB